MSKPLTKDNTAIEYNGYSYVATVLRREDAAAGEFDNSGIFEGWDDSERVSISWYDTVTPGPTLHSALELEIVGYELIDDGDHDTPSELDAFLEVVC